MKTKKLYDIRITKGEYAGCYRIGNIESKETAEMLKEKFFDDSDEIIEREIPMMEEEIEAEELFLL